MVKELDAQQRAGVPQLVCDGDILAAGFQRS
jgi:hypothetical protein